MVKLLATMIIMMMVKKIKSMNNEKKNQTNFMTSIESGFNSINNSKTNLSMNFTYIMVIFILFDIEMMMLIPMFINQKKNNTKITEMMIFLAFIAATTMMEIKNNKIKWSK